MIRYLILRISDLLARAARDRRQLTRGEQLSVVMFFHLGISLVALGIIVLFNAGTYTPWGFFICEGVIIAGCIILTVRVPAFQTFLRAALGPPGAWREQVKQSSNGNAQGSNGNASGQEETAQKGNGTAKEASGVKKAEEIAGAVLIAAFVVQFAALVFLLWATGGPIDSPFAELTLAIAVFTPFLANDPKTVGSVVAASIVYYAGLIAVFSQTHDGTRVDTSVWAYFAVNVMILLGAITFTMYESLARSWQDGMAEFMEQPPEGTSQDDPSAPAET